MSSTPITSDSNDIQTVAAERREPPPRRSFARVLSALVIFLGVTAVKLKGFALLFIERVRIFFVNPFEGFSAMQYAIAGGSMAVTIFAYARSYPLAVVIGFVVITLIHEVGHAVAIRAKGLRAGFMVFIPFVGGAVTLKDQPRSAYDDAVIGLAGPIFGTVASLVSLQLFKSSGEPVFLIVALLGFVLNLINLVPLGMLDGGRISAAITKWMWVIGGGIVVYQVVQRPNPLTILILVLAVFQVYASILREQDDKQFYEVTGAQRAAIAFTYFALVTFLGHQTYMAAHRLEMLAQ
jgi:Zn-dependent protease